MDEIGSLEDLSTPEIREIFLSQLSEDSEYRERLEYHFDVMFETYYHLAAYSYSVNNGRLGRWFFNYFLGRNSEKARKAGVLGGIWGINTRIFDDVMDGDGCKKPDSSERFWRDYKRSFRGDKVESKSEVEDLAFWSARLLSNEFSDQHKEDFIEQLDQVSAVWLDEDKSTFEGYRDYVGAVAQLGEMTVLSTCPVGGEKVSEGAIRIGYEVALVTQIADDIHDGDVPLDDKKLVQYAKDERKDFETLTGIFFCAILSGGYGKFSRLLFKLSKSDNKKYGV